MFSNLKLIFLVVILIQKAIATKSPVHVLKEKYWVDDDKDQKSAIKTFWTSHLENTNERNVSSEHVSAEQHEKRVKMIFQSFGEKQNKLIEFIKKENLSKETVLHQAISQGDENIVEMLLALFKTDSKKLTECLMKEDAYKNTIFHLAAKNGNVKIVNLLMNTFPGDKNEIIQQIMKKNIVLNTALHIALEEGSSEIAQIFLILFKGEPKLLMQYISEENKFGVTSLRLAGEHEHAEVFDLMLNIFENFAEKDLSLTSNQHVEKENENFPPNQKIKKEEENFLFEESNNPVLGQIDSDHINCFKPPSGMSISVPTHTILAKNRVDFTEILIIALFLLCIILVKENIKF